MIDKNKFFKYYNLGYNDKQISEKLNISPMTTGRYRKLNNLPIRTLIDRYGEIISILANQGLNNSEIMRKIGKENISQPMVHSIRKKLNLPDSPNKQRLYSSKKDRLKGKMLVRSKSRAKKLNIEFNLELNDITLLKYCPILDIKLDYFYKKQNNDNAASLDRIDNTKGYVKNNVIIISVLANTMKNKATLSQLLKFCNNIPKILPKIS